MIPKFEGSLGRTTLISEVSGTPGTLGLMGPSLAIERAVGKSRNRGARDNAQVTVLRKISDQLVGYVKIVSPPRGQMLAANLAATCDARSQLNHGWTVGGEKVMTIAKLLKEMVGTRRLELLTSTVSR